MQIRLMVEDKAGRQDVSYALRGMILCGYTGRDQSAVRAHIEELQKEGVDPPPAVPMFYPKPPWGLTLDKEILVQGQETSGEVEYVLLIRDEKTIYVGLGSDHSDRHLEETDIPRCKQICPNVVSKTVWPLVEVQDHWDDLEIQSKVIKDGHEILYQKGLLKLIFDPESLLKFIRSRISGTLDGMVIFSGTLGTLPGEFIFEEKFLAELSDPKLHRSLHLAYDVRPLNYMSVE